MSIAEQLAQVAATLPPERQREVLDYVEFLRQRTIQVPVTKRPGTLGLFAGQAYHVSDDFDAALSDGFWSGEDDEAPR